MLMRVWFEMVGFVSKTGCGTMRVDFPVIDARRNFSGVCGRWYPLILVLHPFFVAVSRAAVNHVGDHDTAADPLVWSVGALSNRRRIAHAVPEWISLAATLSLLRMLGLGHTRCGSWLNGLLS